jgi:hypothetical protein
VTVLNALREQLNSVPGTLANNVSEGRRGPSSLPLEPVASSGTVITFGVNSRPGGRRRSNSDERARITECEPDKGREQSPVWIGELPGRDGRRLSDAPDRIGQGIDKGSAYARIV